MQGMEPAHIIYVLHSTRPHPVDDISQPCPYRNIKVDDLVCWDRAVHDVEYFSASGCIPPMILKAIRYIHSIIWQFSWVELVDENGV